MQTHTIQRGESPSTIAHRYTGDRNRWPELVASNPRMPRVRDRETRLVTFHPKSFRIGTTLVLPTNWVVAMAQPTKNFGWRTKTHIPALTLLLAYFRQPAPSSPGASHTPPSQWDPTYGPFDRNTVDRFLALNRHGLFRMIEESTGVTTYYFDPGTLVQFPEDWYDNTSPPPDVADLVRLFRAFQGFAGVLRGPDGMVGDDVCSYATPGFCPKCTPDPVDPHPTAYYKVQSGDDGPAKAAQRFGQQSNWQQLAGANSTRSLDFRQYPTGCSFGNWVGLKGKLIQVPKNWIDVANPLDFPKSALPFLRTADDKPWTPSTPVDEGCAAGKIKDKDGKCVDQVVPPQPGKTCPPGYGYDTASEKCVQGLSPVKYGDEGKKAEGGVPTWLWIGLAAAAGVGGALLIANLTKGKAGAGATPHVGVTTRSERPLLPAHATR